LLVSSAEGHRIWSASYDDEPNPLLALDTRVLSERLGDLGGLRMIDVACGTGRWIMQARGASVVGIDSSWEMLAVAARKPGLAGRVTLGDAGWLPFGSGVADIALCSMAMNYFASMPEALAEMARVVRGGGRVVVSDLHPDAIAAGWKRSFRSAGSSYEIEHQSFDVHELGAAVDQCSLAPLWHCEPSFGAPERAIFQRAGKQSRFGEVSAYPALHIACWTKL
jgi:SAM-dependent methyltransferase